jgi:tetratricopeptide (TPR) repeat protein
MSDYDVTEYRDVLDGLGDKAAAPDPFADQITEAWQLHINNKNELALDIFNKVLAENAEHMDALYGKGLSLKGLGRTDEAVKNFQRVVELLPTISKDMPGRANMLDRMSKRQISWLQEA